MADDELEISMGEEKPVKPKKNAEIESLKSDMGELKKMLSQLMNTVPNRSEPKIAQNLPQNSPVAQEIKPQIPKEPEIQVPVPQESKGFLSKMFSHKEENILKSGVIDVKQCPKCDSKLDKTKVIMEDENFVQYLKCRNIKCDFHKKLVFKL